MKKFLFVFPLVALAIVALTTPAYAQNGTNTAVGIVELLDSKQAWVVALVAGVISHLVLNFMIKSGIVPDTLQEETRRYIVTAAGIVIPLLWTPAFAYLYDLASLLDFGGYTALGAAAISVTYVTHRLGKGSAPQTAIFSNYEETVADLQEKYIDPLEQNG